MPPFSTFSCPTRITMGVGSHQQLRDVLAELGVARLFVAVDAALRKGDFYQGIARILEDAGIQVTTFSEIEPEPSASTVAVAFDACQAHRAQAVLAVGGGSTMDVAKAVAILATNGGQIQDYEGVEKFKVPPLPRIAIPTTAGTGSEVSGSCVITDTERGLKMSIRHAAMNPANVAILDPLALTTVPAHVAMHAGVDAFVHAFESYISLGANPVTDALNLHAIELISGNIRQYTAHRGNLEAGLAMLCGSTLAGMTFGITGLGNVHCMARFVGTYFHQSHGLSNAICLPFVVDFNAVANPAKYARVAQAMGRHVNGLPLLEAARQAQEAIREMCGDLGVPARLRDIGATDEKFEELARLCVEANYNRWNPRYTTQMDFLQLFQKAY